MTARLTVLASGSAGNATLLEVAGFGLLIDCGLHPRSLAARLRAIGATWNSVHAVILTHTHSDHWKDLALGQFHSTRTPVYGHAEHLDFLNRSASMFPTLHGAGLTRMYAEQVLHELAPGLTCRPIRVSHDSDPTFAFRFDYTEADTAGPAWSIGYASDLGCGSEELVAAFAGVDVLALEYNHDEKMERASQRPKFLVQRVLSDMGHLSNQQAADLTRAVAARSGPGFPHHLVQLHLSKDCNHPVLAEVAGRDALTTLNPAASVLTAKQEVPARSILLERHPDAASRTAARPFAIAVPRIGPRKRSSPSLPGIERR